MALSKRGRSNVDTVIPRIPRTILEAGNSDTDESSIIDMSVAENWLIRDSIIEIEREAVVKRLTSAHLSWPKGFWGDPQLLRVLADFFNTYFSPHTKVVDKHISIAPGVAHAIDALLFNICDPGDGVLCPAPYWNGYDTFCRLRASVTPVIVETETLEDESSFISRLEKTYEQAAIPIKALVIANPHNPLGRCFSRSALEACMKFCEAKDIHFVSDEVFGPFTFSTATATAVAASCVRPFTSVLSISISSVNPARVHVLWGPSKCFAMAGTRIACTITQCNNDLRNALTLASFTNVSALSVLLLTELLVSPRLPSIIRQFQERSAAAYAKVISFFRNLGIPVLECNSGPFVLVKIAPNAKRWEDEAEVINKLREHGVWVSPGKSHHLPHSEMGWARITFALEEHVLQEGLSRIGNVLTNATFE